MTEYNFVIGSKINKTQFRVGEYWTITFICTIDMLKYVQILINNS